MAADLEVRRNDSDNILLQKITRILKTGLINGGGLPSSSEIVSELQTLDASVQALISEIQGGTRTGGFTIKKSWYPTVDTSAYGDGDCVGGLEEIVNVSRIDFPGSTNGSGVVLQDILLYDRDQVKADLMLYFFIQEPADSTFTDQAAADLDVLDIGKLHAAVSIAGSDYVDFGSISVWTKTGLGIVLTPGDTSLWVALVTNGSTPDYTNANALGFQIGFLQD